MWTTLIPYLVSALLAGAVGAYGMHRWDLGTIETAKANQALAEKGQADINTIVAKADAAQERQRVSDAQKTADTIRMQAQTIADLQANAENMKELSDFQFAALQKELANATKANTRPLGPVASHALDELRKQQQARNAGGNPATSGNN